MAETSKEIESKEVNDICKDCLFWKQFQDKCYVHWYGKKFCSMRVVETTDYEETKNLFKIDQ